MSSQQPMDSISRKIDELVAKVRQDGGITMDQLHQEMPDGLFSDEQLLKTIDRLETQGLLLDGYNAYVQEIESSDAAEADDSSFDPSDSLQLYLRGIRQYGLLTPEREKKLSRRIIEKHDERAKEELIQHNLRYVVHVAKQFRQDNMPLLDMIQEGNIGLTKAAETFDHRKSRFTTYADVHIRRALYAHYKSTAFDRRLNDRNYQEYKQIKKLLDAARAEGKPKPDVQQIADALSISSENVLSAISLINSGGSLDNTVSNDDDCEATVGDFVQYRDALSPDDQALAALEKDSLSAMVEDMIPRHALALRLYYGGYTDEAAAGEMELSRERYIRLRDRAVLQLKISDRYKEWKDRRKHD